MTLEAFIKYPVVFLVGLLAALLLTPVWSRLAVRLGLVDVPGGRKQHSRPVPVAGGLAVFAGFHVACAAVFLLPWQAFVGQIAIDWWLEFLLLSTGVVALGLWDDWRGSKPLVKLAGQVVLAGAAYACGIRLQNVLGIGLPLWFDFVATVFWFLLLMNSFNLIDGIDGLSTGIAVIASLGIGLSLVFRKQPGDVLLFLGFVGACIGFLRYNFYPARVFLGDTGSLFIGFTLAALSISTSSKASTIAAIGMPLLAVGVPLFDTVLAVWRRSVRRVLRTGASGGALGIDQADADHLHHRLLRQGRRHDQVAWLLYAATALLAGVGILVSIFNDRVMGILGLSFLIAAYTVFRHLAWIELRESGTAVLRGITRPVRRNTTLIIYIVLDVALLNAALLSTILLVAAHDGETGLRLKDAWMRSAPFSVFVPFGFLLLFRAYSRVWYLARISEYMAAGLAVVLGYATGFCLSILFQPHVVNPWTQLLNYVLMAGTTAPGVVGVRAALRLIQDTMFWRLRDSGSTEKPVMRALLVGAGFESTLFLRQIATAAGHEDRTLVICGMIDRDPAIRGHYVHGIKVLGSCHDLSVIVREQCINQLYLIRDLDEDEQAITKQVIKEFGLSCRRWSITETNWP